MLINCKLFYSFFKYFFFFIKGVTELEINDFTHTKAILNGFSILDYNDVTTLKSIADITQSAEPLNKIATIPVSLQYC